MNGENSVQVDRGLWLYRFALDAGKIAIYRSRRAGQDLVQPDVWRWLATVGVSDAFILPVEGEWQPFIELGEGSQRWSLGRRPTQAQAEEAARHFLESLADALAHAAPVHTAHKEGGEVRAQQPPLPTTPPSEAPAAEELYGRAVAAREATGWQLVYSRQRALR